MPVADRRDGEPRGVEGLARCHPGDVDAVDGGACRGEDREPGGHEALRVDVVGMLVRHEHGVGAHEGLRLAPHARVDDQDAAVLLEPDTGVGVLGDLHREIVRDGRRVCVRPVAGSTG